MEAVSTVDRWIFAWCSLTQRARRWQGQLEDSLQPHDLSAVELLVLWRTGHATSPGISQVELSRELSVSTAQVCGVVETLHGRGWLQTTRPPEDRRRLYCQLTPTGELELKRLRHALLPMAQRCLLNDPPMPSVNREDAA
jgi:DNA-binding MarR family transcriptional regulator